MCEKAFMNWSSGKDSAMALYETVRTGLPEVVSLFTVVDAETERIPMHEVGTGLLERQAAAIGLPLTLLRIGPDTHGYEDAMREAVDSFKEQGISTAVFGDINFVSVREVREEKCRRAGLKTVFPLWGIPEEELLRAFVSAGFKAVITCVDTAVADGSLVGRIINADFIRDVPRGTDICGESGWYHSFVFDGPVFNRSVDFRITGYGFRDYPPVGEGGAASRFVYAEIE